MIEIHAGPAAEPVGTGRPPAVAQSPEQPSWALAMWRGFRNRCPHCGEGRLFHRFLKVRHSCEACGTELHHHRADDLPPYLVIFVVGHLAGIGILESEMRLDVPLWFQMTFWPGLASSPRCSCSSRPKGRWSGCNTPLACTAFPRYAAPGPGRRIVRAGTRRRRGMAAGPTDGAPAPERKARPLRIRNAATLIILDRSGDQPKVLMGKRHAGHKFMPGCSCSRAGGSSSATARCRSPAPSTTGPNRRSPRRSTRRCSISAGPGARGHPRDLRGDRADDRLPRLRPARDHAARRLERVSRGRGDAGPRTAPVRRPGDHAAVPAQALRHPVLRRRPRGGGGRDPRHRRPRFRADRARLGRSRGGAPAGPAAHHGNRARRAGGAARGGFGPMLPVPFFQDVDGEHTREEL